MGYTDLNCPEIPSRRRLADESPGQQTTMDNLPHAHHHPRNASNQWIPTIYQILIQTRITSELCHKPAFSDGTYLNHQDHTTTFLSLYKIRYVKVFCTIKYQVYPTPHTHCHDNTYWTFHFTLFTTYMIFHQSNNVCHYNCSFSFTYLHVWYSQSMTLYHHFPIFMVGLFPTTPHSVHILIHKYQTANTYHVIFISSVI